MCYAVSFKAHEIAEVAGCSARSVYAIKSNIRRYGSTKAPPNGGRPRSITPMFDALRERLLEKYGLCPQQSLPSWAPFPMQDLRAAHKHSCVPH
jgi:transposase